MADAYLQSLLADNESVRSEARQHPMALIRFAFQPILVFIGAMVLLGIGSWLTPDGQGLFSDVVRWIDTLLGLLTAGMFILAVVWFPIQVFRWVQRRYMVTDRRVLYVDGVLRKNSVDAGLSMITDVGFRQGVLGRTLGYGDLVIATASNRPLHFRQIRDALAFKQAIMGAQHATVEARADEILVSKGLTPAPAATVAAPAAAVASPAAAPVAAAAIAEAADAPAEPAAPPVPAWDGSDVPQMAEDDTPPADPAIFGTPGVETATDAPEDDTADAEPDQVAEAVEETTDQVAEAVEETTDQVAEAVEESVPEPATAGGHVAALDDVDSKLGAISTDAKGTGADSVTSALARLAELRDTGAITNDEFETRKQELLDRL